MHFLNPPNEVYGTPGALDSVQYRAIKAEAEEELKLRTKDRGRPKDPKLEKEYLLLFVSALRNHHFPPRREPVHDPITQLQLAKILNWDQTRVHRCFKLFFKSNKPMEVYKTLCKSGGIVKKGFVMKHEDGLSSIEAFEGEDDEDDDDDSDED